MGMNSITKRSTYCDLTLRYNPYISTLTPFELHNSKKNYYCDLKLRTILKRNSQYTQKG
jgi:hypothetical protein